MVIALMLGRDGSTGFPGKNTFPVLNRPMMSYPLMAAKAAKEIDEIYVSTDSPKIIEVARKFGVQIIDRPTELATKSALGEDAYVHGFEHIRDLLDEPIEMVVLLFCNAPTILGRTLDKGIQILRKNAELDSAVTVSSYNMWSPIRARKIGPDGLLHPFLPLESFGELNAINCDRDSQGDIFFADMSVSLVRPRCLGNLEYGILPQRWMGQQIYPLEQWGGCDIDYDWQVPGVEHWLRQHGFTETETPYKI